MPQNVTSDQTLQFDILGISIQNNIKVKNICVTSLKLDTLPTDNDGKLIQKKGL